MKHRKQWIAAALSAALLMGLFTGCGGSSAAVASTAAVYENEQTQMTTDSAGTAGTGNGALESGPTAPQDSRKIIYNASLWLESKQYEQASADLMAAAEQAGGYIQDSEQSGSAERGDRSASYTLRIPSENYSTFMNAAAQTANLVRRSESTQDATAEYVDLEARLASLEQQRQRLDELAAQAENLEDLLAIEEQRTQVQYQIESYTGQMRVLAEQIAYSTVEVYLDEVSELTPQSPSFASRVASAFRNSWSGFGGAVQNFVIALIYLMPFALCMAVVVTVVILLARRAAKRRPKAPVLPANPSPQQPPRNEEAGTAPKYGPMK